MNETLKRGLSGFVYVALLIFCTLYNPLSFCLLYTVFMCLSIWEFSKLVQCNYYYIFIIIGVVFAGISIFENSISPKNNLIIVLGSCIHNIILLLGLFNEKQYQKTARPFSHTFLYITIPFILLIQFPYLAKPANFKLVLAMFIMIWCNDTFAYLVGKSIGKTKLLEKVSPKKTIEGFVGGIVFTIIAAVIIAQFFKFFSVTLWIVTAIIITTLGTLGDLVQSKFKREAGVKDSGNIMPGHGGILDRLDSVIFVTPFLYLFYLIYFYYV
jgi:phosphatidate cytidylyltransferase